MQGRVLLDWRYDSGEYFEGGAQARVDKLYMKRSSGNQGLGLSSTSNPSQESKKLLKVCMRQDDEIEIKPKRSELHESKLHCSDESNMNLTDCTRAARWESTEED